MPSFLTTTGLNWRFCFHSSSAINVVRLLIASAQTSELALPALRGRLQKNASERSYVPHLNFQAVSCYWFASGRGRAGAIRT